MDSLFIVIKSFVKAINRINGSIFSFIILVGFALLRIKISERIYVVLKYASKNSVVYFFIIFIISGIFYLFYPTFLNHIEPTVASIGLAMKKGEDVYPLPVGSYPYNGILYGPALFAIQMVFQNLGLPVILGSKLPGLLVFIATAFILLRLDKSWVYRGYLLFLFPFGLMLFWNRAEPFLLMLVVLTLFITMRFSANKKLPLLIGILGGLASALKLHGAAYIFAAYLAAINMNISIVPVFLFITASLSSFFLFFIPYNVSFDGFLAYIAFAGYKHGLSFSLFLESFIYLISLFLPFFLLRKDKFKSPLRFNLFLILIIEFLITIVASKHGNGFYHLMPFIPVNGLIISRCIKLEEIKKELLTLLYTCMVFITIITVVTDFILPMGKSWGIFYEAKKEIECISEKRPDIIMGVTGDDGYPYTFYRVMLKNRQIDYASFMDLQISGIGDEALIERLKYCRICCIVIPNTGEPFTMRNYYTSRPLFSNNVRETFLEEFSPVEKLKYYSVYRCKKTGKEPANN